MVINARRSIQELKVVRETTLETDDQGARARPMESANQCRRI